MASFSKFGGLLLRQSISGSNGSAPVMHMLNSARYMSPSKLFVRALPYNIGDQSLKDLFTRFGTVTEAKVITDLDTGRSRGFGFVNFDTEESAGLAMSTMNGQALHGRLIQVGYASAKPSGGFLGGGFGGFGAGVGGYRRQPISKPTISKWSYWNDIPITAYTKRPSLDSISFWLRCNPKN